MPSPQRPVESLRPTDLMTQPVWEFTSVDEPDETYVHPVAERPINSLENRIVGTEVELANRSLVWALLGNIAINDVRQTRHFLTVSVFLREEWFHLARYHDLDHDERGPKQLAEVLGLAIDEVFPIHYDIGEWVPGAATDVVRGTVYAVPLERLSRPELIKLAVSDA
jgi:hypothetical protein